MDRLQIERIGGFAGYGGPHLKAKGEVALSSLSATDKKAIDSLFVASSKSAPSHPGEADAFRYRIIRQTPEGPQTIVVPGVSVPLALKDSVQDVIE